MSLGGGPDRSWMKPLRVDGSLATEDPNLDGMIGCHRGRMSGFNVIGAQPGCEYTWERLELSDQIRLRTEGAQYVKDGDPESAAMSRIVSEGLGASHSLSSLVTNGEVALVRWPIEVVRRKNEQEQARALAMSRGGAEDYVQRATAAERAAGGGRSTRFRRADHGLDFEDAQGRVVDRWSPDEGIIPKG